ncbi:histone-lysine N-methyltransferase NSD2-like isoform X2 [Gigantopelta aegis]|uniref:histone-lysine N-methyltransferase NSD2-like isoform X2 n=1 Tax=Gigantopelta aegis TaxID=1735272 RepID=UPI001B8895D6|nr:histone-lysine N-methyltransferase NSD2-like isoform X2 [Gigantopelta aegis]
MESQMATPVNGLGSQTTGGSGGFHHHLPQMPTMNRNLKIAQSKASAKCPMPSPDKREGLVNVESAVQPDEPQEAATAKDTLPEEKKTSDDQKSRKVKRDSSKTKTEVAVFKPRTSVTPENKKTERRKSSSAASDVEKDADKEKKESPTSIANREKRQIKRKLPQDETEVAEKAPKEAKAAMIPKAAVVKAPVSKVEKEKPPKWLVGDLLWAKVSGHPWWPCMVSYDPYTGLYTRITGGFKVIRAYHVQFFGNEGERGWINESSTMPFEGKEQFFKYGDQCIANAPNKKQKTVLSQSFKVKPSRRPAWEVGVAGAEEAVPMDRNERKQKLTFVYILPETKEKVQIKDSADTELTRQKKAKASESTTDLSNGVVDKGQGKRGRKRKEGEMENTGQSQLTPKKRRIDSETAKSPTVPHRPVRSHGSFECFCQKHREGVLEEHPDYDEDTVVDYLLQQWTMMSEKQKARYAPSKHGTESTVTVKPETVSPSSTKRPQREPETRERRISGRIQAQEELNADTSPPTKVKIKAVVNEQKTTKSRPAKEPKQHVSIEKQPSALMEVKIEPVEIKPEAKPIKPKVSTVAEAMEKLAKNGSDVMETLKSEVKDILDIKKKRTKASNLETQSQTSDSGSESQHGEIRPTSTCQSTIMIKNGTEEYQLEIFKLSASAPPKKENICQICEGVGELIECQGSCQGHFHASCLGIAPMAQFKCDECQTGIHTCFACKEASPDVKLCATSRCGKFYHESCVKKFPNTVFEGKKFFCPLHVCATCAADEDKKNCKSAKGRLLRCVRCPTAYHIGEYCLAAGSINLPGYHIVCSSHFKPNRSTAHHSHINVSWCFMCSKGGTLLCCESCPAAFHAECLKIEFPEGSFYCHDCRRGRKPLYGDIIWVKLGSYRWWPGEICHPRHVPTNIQDKPHQVGEFPVRFYGSHDFFWIYQGRVFLFQDGDKGSKDSAAKGLAKIFSRGVDEATQAFKIWKAAKERKEQQKEEKSALKPAPYKFIKTNIPVGSVQILKADISQIPKCECRPDQENPCSSEEDCLNRMLMYECHPSNCPAGDKCQNQRFQKRQYPESVSYKSPGLGWGLKTLVDIKKGQFVNEYVGELIDEDECHRRIEKAHIDNISNFYMLTLDKNRIIDAGPKGNLSRFMNHCCQPNCETQKWMVNGDIRVGLFASRFIPAGSELTFNYNLDCLGNEKKTCCCGAENCSGFLGVRPKTAAAVATEKKSKEAKKKKKKKKIEVKKEHEDDCFRCGEGGELVMCDHNSCPKVYHLQCLKLTKPPPGKWLCPWHHCDECGKQSKKMCTQCPNSFCPAHIKDNIFNVDGILVCSDHDSFLEGKTLDPVEVSSDGASECNTDTNDGKSCDTFPDSKSEFDHKPVIPKQEKKPSILDADKKPEDSKTANIPGPLKKRPVPSAALRLETQPEKKKGTVVNSERKANIKSRPPPELGKPASGSAGVDAKDSTTTTGARGKVQKSGGRSGRSGSKGGDPLTVVAPLFDDSDEDDGFQDLVIDIPTF